jgi:hypothetical protein
VVPRCGGRVTRPSFPGWVAKASRVAVPTDAVPYVPALATSAFPTETATPTVATPEETSPAATPTVRSAV